MSVISNRSAKTTQRESKPCQNESSAGSEKHADSLTANANLLTPRSLHQQEQERRCPGDEDQASQRFACGEDAHPGGWGLFGAQRCVEIRGVIPEIQMPVLKSLDDEFGIVVLNRDAKN